MIIMKEKYNWNLQDIFENEEQFKKEKSEITDILEKIISGKYDDNFIILNPGEVLEEKMFRFNGK